MPDPPPLRERGCDRLTVVYHNEIDVRVNASNNVQHQDFFSSTLFRKYLYKSCLDFLF
jgi:hypothetical protein